MKFRDLITHQLDSNCRTETVPQGRASERVWELIAQSRFFTVEPMPDGMYEINVKEDAAMDKDDAKAVRDNAYEHGFDDEEMGRNG